MKHKKKVTQAVLGANRANSRSSTGPSTKQGKSNFKPQRSTARHTREKSGTGYSRTTSGVSGAPACLQNRV
jgi:hypothetical protein